MPSERSNPADHWRDILAGLAASEPTESASETPTPTMRFDGCVVSIVNGDAIFSSTLTSEDLTRVLMARRKADRPPL